MIYGAILEYWGHIITHHDLLPYVSLKQRRPGEWLSRYIAIYGGTVAIHGVTIAIYGAISGYWDHVITCHNLLPCASLSGSQVSVSRYEAAVVTACPMSRYEALVLQQVELLSR